LPIKRTTTIAKVFVVVLLDVDSGVGVGGGEVALIFEC
jgi:hypothetical protein